MQGTYSNGLILPDLIPGKLIKRYKRFLADVELENGEVVTAHCPNTGTMKACSEPGRKVYLSFHDNPKRKYKYTWEIIKMPTSLVGVNTLIPNRLVYHSIKAGRLEPFAEYDEVRSEVKVGEKHRLDLMLSKNGPNPYYPDPCYIEIKNCSLVEDGTAFFPDAVTVRGRNHLMELQRLAFSGFRTVMFFLVNRMDAKIFKPADHIDPAYGKELRKAYQNGIEIIVYDVSIDLDQRKVVLRKPVPFQL
ncbi:MAG: DNA/RNA nuclease SfsA [Desulfobacteraceae bacterium]|nr:DNA/RNA nuclease SfsA [Desulfobacteraceae bacterium]MBC2756328.1 DNA/RNA nuclease SfsA [Desulfobacteraceae bacterium]